MALAQLEDSKSQSCGFQAKPGRHITTNAASTSWLEVDAQWASKGDLDW
jgi:hypothetical protein